MSFISVAFVVVKVKIFKAFCTDSASIKWPLFWGFEPLLSQILFHLAEILTRFSLPIRQIQCFKNLSKLYILAQIPHLKFTVLVHFGTQFTTRKPKIMLKTKISAKTTSLGVSQVLKKS